MGPALSTEGRVMTIEEPVIIGDLAPAARPSFASMQSMAEPWMSAAAQGDAGFLEWWRRCGSGQARSSPKASSLAAWHRPGSH